MLLRLTLLLAFLCYVRTKDDFSRNGIEDRLRFALWPSVHNGATLFRTRRENQGIELQGASEGLAGPKPQAPAETPILPLHKVVNVTDNIKGGVKNDGPITGSAGNEPKNEGTPISQPIKNETSIPAVKPDESQKGPPKTPISNETPKGQKAATTPTVESTPVVIKDNGTTSMKATKEWDLSDPEATKRGLIVFGGFALLALGYYMFFGTKKNYKDTKNSNTNDANQFRYGVLQSEDRRENLELSRVPLTMESDDEEDEDLEIFDLEQKKKSLSYVNLQTDEDIVLSPRERSDGDHLLLDIEDGNSDTLINWSNNGSKSIL